MKRTGRVGEARKLAISFLNSYPCNYWYPWIALDICHLEGDDDIDDVDHADLKNWLQFFQEKGCPMTTVLAHLQARLMDLCIWDGFYERAIEIEEKLINFQKAENGIGTWTEFDKEYLFRMIQTVR